MRIGEYLSLRDRFLESEVYRELRVSGISDEKSEAVVAHAFSRAQQKWLEAQPSEVTNLLEAGKLPFLQ